MEECLTFPVSLWWFRVLVLCTPATKDCRLTHGINLDYRNTFSWKSIFYVWLTHRLSSKNFNWQRAKCQRIRLTRHCHASSRNSAVLSLVKLCDEHGYTYHWRSGQNPHLIKNGNVPFVVPGLSTSSFTTPTPPSSSSQDSAFDVSRYTENPVPKRSGTTSGEFRGNPLPKTKIKNRESEEVHSDISHELLDWLQEFRENLVHKLTPSEPRRNPEHGYRDTSSSSHELPMEPRAKVEPGSAKHNVCSHFPKDPGCDICLKTKKQGLLAEDVLSGTLWWLDYCRSQISQWRKVSRGTIIDIPWWYRTWQHSGYNHTRANQKLPRDPEELDEGPGANEEAKCHLHWQDLGIWQVLRGIILESLCVNTTQIRNKCDCWESRTQIERTYVCCIVAIRSGWKMVLSAKHSRSLVWREDPNERRFGMPFDGPVIPFGAMVE